jgi:hypothetical protein
MSETRMSLNNILSDNKHLYDLFRQVPDVRFYLGISSVAGNYLYFVR